METTASRDGTHIAYERSGDGPPLVLVHGATADHTRWQPARAPLEEHFTLYAVDRRGRGASGDADAYALEREFEDVAAVVNAIDESVNLLGHSYGALCSLEASLRTDNLRRLILYEPPIPVRGHQLLSEEALVRMKASIAEGDKERALIVFLSDVAHIPAAQMDVLRAAPNWPARVDVAARTIVREAQAPPNYDFQPKRFAEMTTPTLLLSGSESPRFMADATRAVDEALPDSRIMILEGQDHVAMNTAPDLFVQAVVDFLTG